MKHSRMATVHSVPKTDMIYVNDIVCIRFDFIRFMTTVSYHVDDLH